MDQHNNMMPAVPVYCARRQYGNEEKKPGTKNLRPLRPIVGCLLATRVLCVEWMHTQRTTSNDRNTAPYHHHHCKQANKQTNNGSGFWRRSLDTDCPFVAPSAHTHEPNHGSGHNNDRQREPPAPARPTTATTTTTVPVHTAKVVVVVLLRRRQEG